ncbi:DUF6282 family protein [Legionella quateirensis]|uniref:Amidohydrolase n=1 Tax=Legionella quateirensis TaxID=45072 RepID=A0A378KX76_9GAMM|nr:DUF6282 family protein [Legionella quateirensis]KTD52756.1 hypothetical protein Lqua_0589 [Legionella quateirensis]STY19175.1 Uncharacterised protein [Legionella quateirensis]
MQALDDYKLIDIHYHANPDLYLRRWDALEAGKIYQSINGAVVLKSHLGATSIQATLAQRIGLPVLPSLVLNHIAGGINFRAVLQALNEYQPLIPARMIVHFPTITGRKIKSRLSRTVTHPELAPYSLRHETLFNDHYQLRDEVIDVLKMAKDYPIVLSTGHASADELYQLVDACIQYNVRSLLLNQPANPLTNLNATQLKELAKHEFIWIEQTLLTYVLEHQTKEDFGEVLSSLPRVIYSSDLGQTDQMDIKHWIDYSEHVFSELKLSEQRKKELLSLNALNILKL